MSHRLNQLLFALILISIALPACESNPRPTPTAEPTSTVLQTVRSSAQPADDVQQLPTVTPEAPTEVATSNPTAMPTTASLLPTVAPTIFFSQSTRSVGVLFVREGDLWTFDLADAKLRRLTSNKFYRSPAGESTAPGDFFWNPPRVSPNGRYVIAASSARGTWLFSMDGSGPRQITSGFAEVSWSPGSDALTYSLGYDGTGRIYVRALDAWGKPRILNSPAYRKGIFPKWSPDGHWIAFLDFPPTKQVGSALTLIVVRPDGSGAHVLDSFELGGRDYGYRDLQWSSDGRRLLVQDSGLWGFTAQGIQQIQNARRLGGKSHVELLSPSGAWVESDLIRTINAQIPAPNTPPPNDYQGCAWSLDGGRLACVVPSFSDTSSVLIVTDIERRQPSRLKLDLPQLQEIRWLPDGNELLVGSAVSPYGTERIWRVRLDSMAPPQLITQGMLLDTFIIK
jgi:WD40 repeat protein